MSESLRWLALGYSVPINPSKNRVYVWRKLKEYGAEYFKQGVALLPYSRNSYSKFKYLAAKIKEMDGEASIVEMKFIDPKDEQAMVAQFRSQAWEELSQLKKDCAAIMSQLSRQTVKHLTDSESEEIKKIIKRFSKARDRSHFCLTLAEDVEHGLYSLIDLTKATMGDAAVQFVKAMDKAVK